AGAPMAELERSLVTEVLEARCGHTRDFGLTRRVTELRERRDPGRMQSKNLVAADLAHAGQVVVLVPPGLATPAELADGAVLDRVRLGRRALVDSVKAPLQDTPAVGQEVEG